MDDEIESIGRIETSRRINRKIATICSLKGATVEELAIAAVYSGFDLAEQHAGTGQVAIEWLRTAIDVLELGLTDKAPRAH
jgi:anaerobic glycerol-3-phosphate dehydrogenase